MNIFLHMLETGIFQLEVDQPEWSTSLEVHHALADPNKKVREVQSEKSGLHPVAPFTNMV